MITYMPFSDFGKSARAMTRTHLAQSRAAALNVLNVLTFSGTLGREDLDAYGRDPCVLMWKGHGACLLDYGLTLSTELRCRQLRQINGGPGADASVKLSRQHKELLQLISRYGPSYNSTPPKWLGLEAVHSNHRSVMSQAQPACYPQQWETEGPQAPGVLWPEARSGARWAYESAEGEFAMTRPPERRLRFDDMVQCAYCNYWHNPEELTDADSHSGRLPVRLECDVCQGLLSQRQDASELSSLGPECAEVGAELFASVWETIRLTRLGLL